MTYNNTIWDKLQLIWPKLKKWLFWVIILGITLSSLGNIFRQYSTLVEANKENQKLIEKIRKIEKENKFLTQKIEYATSSAFIEEETRDKLGLGTKNDYWIEFPKDRLNNDWYPNTNVGDKEPPIKRWISLFTR